MDYGIVSTLNSSIRFMMIGSCFASKRKSSAIVFRWCFRTKVRSFGTSLAAKRLIPKYRLQCAEAFHYISLSSLDYCLRLVWRYSRTISFTSSRFSSVLAVEGHPEQGKSSITVRPLLKSLYHTHTPVFDKSVPPKAFCNIFNDSA